MEQLKVLFLQSMGSPVYLVHGSKEFTSIPQVMPLISAKQWSTKDLSVNQHLTNDNMINTTMEYIKYIPLDAYSMAEKSLHNLSSNASDIGKAMKHQVFVSKSTFYQ